MGNCTNKYTIKIADLEKEIQLKNKAIIDSQEQSAQLKKECQSSKTETNSLQQKIKILQNTIRSNEQCKSDQKREHLKSLPILTSALTKGHIYCFEHYFVLPRASITTEFVKECDLCDGKGVEGFPLQCTLVDAQIKQIKPELIQNNSRFGFPYVQKNPGQRSKFMFVKNCETSVQLHCCICNKPFKQVIDLKICSKCKGKGGV